MVKKPKRKLVKGVDFHGWVNKYPVVSGDPKSEWVLGRHIRQVEPRGKPLNGGKWVKVKLVEVE